MTEWGIDTLFNPGKRHMDEEKRRLQSTREEIGDSSGGKRIDLEAGVVRISRPKPSSSAEASSEELAAVADTEAADTEAADTQAPDTQAPDTEAVDAQAVDAESAD